MIELEAGLRGTDDNLLIFKDYEQWERWWFSKNIGTVGIIKDIKKNFKGGNEKNPRRKLGYNLNL